MRVRIARNKERVTIESWKGEVGYRTVISDFAASKESVDAALKQAFRKLGCMTASELMTRNNGARGNISIQGGTGITLPYTRPDMAQANYTYTITTANTAQVDWNNGVVVQ